MNRNMYNYRSSQLRKKHKNTDDAQTWLVLSKIANETQKYKVRGSKVEIFPVETMADEGFFSSLRDNTDKGVLPPMSRSFPSLDTPSPWGCGSDTVCLGMQFWGPQEQCNCSGSRDAGKS